ncbi:MAG: sensor domain-containing protein, partial [Pseudonocardia sp.]|nr:sensor domain-containing protein [Pseudonocardia sp.]
MINATTATYAASSSRVMPVAGRRVAPITNAAKAAGRDLVYLTAVLGSSIVGFVVWVTGLSVTAGLAVLAFGVLVWVPASLALRGVASLDRGLAGWYRRQPVDARYRRPPSKGVVDRFKTAVTDPRVWADLRWVVLNS